MSAGFPTDDPWGDRQQPLPLPLFAQLLQTPLLRSWTPGTQFEYSNLSYALLGRVVERVTGRPYREAMHALLLQPLALTRTGFDSDESVPGDSSAGSRLATGYVRALAESGRALDSAPAQFVAEPFAGYGTRICVYALVFRRSCYHFHSVSLRGLQQQFLDIGAFAPMGGLFSCIQDLSRWINFLSSAWRLTNLVSSSSSPSSPAPNRPCFSSAHFDSILSPASRREMQQPWRSQRPELSWSSLSAPPEVTAPAYGFGLESRLTPVGQVGLPQ